MRRNLRIALTKMGYRKLDSSNILAKPVTYTMITFEPEKHTFTSWFKTANTLETDRWGVSTHPAEVLESGETVEFFESLIKGAEASVLVTHSFNPWRGAWHATDWGFLTRVELAEFALEF
jgi:hypothetical protein